MEEHQPFTGKVDMGEDHDKVPCQTGCHGLQKSVEGQGLCRVWENFVEEDQMSEQIVVRV